MSRRPISWLNLGLRSVGAGIVVGALAGAKLGVADSTRIPAVVQAVAWWAIPVALLLAALALATWAILLTRAVVLRLVSRTRQRRASREPKRGRRWQRRRHEQAGNDESVDAVRSAFTHIPRIRPYMRPYRGLMAFAALLTILSALVSLALPWPMAFLVDSALGDREPIQIVARIVGDSPGRRILFAALAGLVLTLVSNGISIINSYVQTRFEQRMILDFRSDLFAHVQRLSMAFHDNQRKGMLMFAINNQASAVGGITSVLLPLAENVLTIGGMAYVAFRLDPRLALLSMTVVPGIYFSARYYAAHVEPKLRHARNLEGTSLSIVHEAMSMLRVIVAYGRERHEHYRFRSQGREAVDARVDVTVRQTAFSLGVNVITAVGTALVIGYGAHLVLRGSLTVGQLLVMLAYIAAVYQPLEAISGTAASLQEQLISLEAAVGLRDHEPEVKDPEPGIVLKRARGEVTFDNVGFNYQGREETLVDISCDVPAGHVVGIVGATGAGKSTLVSLIPRFFDPKQGRILLDGIDLRDIKLESLRAQISLVLQEPLLFSGTIGDNLRYGNLNSSAKDLVVAAEAANAHGFITRLPKQYDTVLGERGAQLSGGERQRLCIARAFLKDAPVLILDEPTSAVDSTTEAGILEALNRLIVGRTTFMIAHRLSTIRRADRILVMDNGRIVDSGTHDELIDRPGLYRDMHEAQSGRTAYAGSSS